MKIKVSIQIIFKIMIIVLMIIYLPSYSHQNVKVFKAILTTEALQTSVPDWKEVSTRCTCIV